MWWSPSLLLHQPDWLREPRGADVLPATQWLPWVTFWQVTADMVYSTGVPDGHGHVYKKEYVDAWAAVTQPAGWTAADTTRLRKLHRLAAARSCARFNRVLTVAPGSVQSEDGPRAERLRRGRSLAATGHAERTGETGCPLERERAMVSHRVRVGHRVLVVVASAAVVTSMSWAGAASANQQASSRQAPTSGRHLSISCEYSTLCPDLADSKQVYGEDEYVGHDEPSLVFYSNKAGAGNRMRYNITLPKEPSRRRIRRSPARATTSS